MIIRFCYVIYYHSNRYFYESKQNIAETKEQGSINISFLQGNKTINQFFKDSENQLSRTICVPVIIM